MAFILAGLLGWVIGQATGPRPTVTVIENGAVVEEVKSLTPVLVIKEGDQVELRKVRDPLKPHEKRLVKTGKPAHIYRDSRGNVNFEPSSYYEDVEADQEETVWASQPVETK